MPQTRRTILAAIGAALPLGMPSRSEASSSKPTGPAPALRLRSFEQSVRDAFAPPSESESSADADPAFPCRRIEVGCSDLIQAGVQGRHNDQPFAGFPAGHLRVIRTGATPGPIRQGVRLYVSTVDVVLTGGLAAGLPSRPLDFSTIPPAPTLS